MGEGLAEYEKTCSENCMSSSVTATFLMSERLNPGSSQHRGMAANDYSKLA